MFDALTGFIKEHCLVIVIFLVLLLIFVVIILGMGIGLAKKENMKLPWGKGESFNPFSMPSADRKMFDKLAKRDPVNSMTSENMSNKEDPKLVATLFQ